MSKLYEIANDYAKLLDEDLEPELIADTLEGMEGELKDKIEQLLAICKNETGYAERLKEEAKSLNERAAATMNRVERIQEYISSLYQLPALRKSEPGFIR